MGNAKGASKTQGIHTSHHSRVSGHPEGRHRLSVPWCLVVPITEQEEIEWADLTFLMPTSNASGLMGTPPREETMTMVNAKTKGYESTSSDFDIDSAITSLKDIQWDFPNAKTNDLTHNIHPYPAKFIPQIPSALIQELSSPGETVGDIFCGSGTTLLESLRHNRHTVGIDANPLAVLISKSKITNLSVSDFNEICDHRLACDEIRSEIVPEKYLLWKDTPFMSNGWRPSPDICEFWFVPHVVEELAEILKMIERVESKTARLLCKAAFSGIIVRVSKQDSDTRYVRREKNIKPGATLHLYLKRLDALNAMAREMNRALKGDLSRRVILADLMESPETPPFDLVVTSPPYPNAYSYHLYHRTRLMWLGYDPLEFKTVEIGSHRKYSAKGPNRATPETFRREFEMVFTWLRDRLNDGRHACFVIGDSKIRGEMIDNASMIADTGRASGFREIARIDRTIASNSKALNPKIGRIKSEKILIMRKD